MSKFRNRQREFPLDSYVHTLHGVFLASIERSGTQRSDVRRASDSMSDMYPPMGT